MSSLLELELEPLVSKIHDSDTDSRIEPLTDLQQEAYKSVFNPNREHAPIHAVHSNKSKTSKKKGEKHKVQFNEETVSKKECQPGKRPSFDVRNKFGNSVKIVPFLNYLGERRNMFCKNKAYPNYVWDASIDKYCCSESPEDVLTRLNHLLDTLENGVGNVNINSSSSSHFDTIKDEINRIFKLLFPDDTGFGDETDKRNFEIRQQVEDKLDSLISGNDTGLPTSRQSPSDYSWAWKEGIPTTTTLMANARWRPLQPGGRRRPSSKKNKSKKSKKSNKSKKSKKVNMQNTKRIRRIR